MAEADGGMGCRSCAALLTGAGPAARAATGAVHVTNYTRIAQPDAITAGPDGALWFTNAGDNTIGRITTP